MKVITFSHSASRASFSLSSFFSTYKSSNEIQWKEKKKIWGKNKHSYVARDNRKNGNGDQAKYGGEKQRCCISHSPPPLFHLILFSTLSLTGRKHRIFSIFLEPLSYSVSSPKQLHSSTVEAPNHLKSSPLAQQHRRSAMEAAVNYTDSYDTLTSNHLKRTGSTRQYAASLQRPLVMDAKPVFITAKVADPPKRTLSTVSNELYDSAIPSLRVSGRIHSSTSLSSTGYDSNSSPSIKSNRNSVATTNSNDFIAHSTSSSSSASLSSSSDEQQRKAGKPWVSCLLHRRKVIRNNCSSDTKRVKSNQSESISLHFGLPR